MPMPDRPRLKPADIEAAKKFIARFSNPEEAVRRLLTDNRRYRDRERDHVPSSDATDEARRTISRLQEENDELTREVDDLSERIPKDGTAVLPKADADELAEFRQLGKLAEVQKAVKDAAELGTKVEESDLRTITESGAAVLGWNKAALFDLAKDKGVAIEMRTEKVDGKDVAVPYARFKNAKEGEPMIKLTEFAEKNLATYIPSLKAVASGMSQQSTTPHGGIQIPAQGSATDTAPSGGVADQFIRDRDNRNKAKTNPFMSPTPATTTK